MKKFPVLFFFILFSLSVFSTRYIFEPPNFSLALSVGKNIIIKEARLLSPDGIEINFDSGSHLFSGHLDLYSTFTLVVTYQQGPSEKAESFSIPLFLQEGESELRFVKIPDQFSIYGASEENSKKYRTLLEKDRATFGKLRKSQLKLETSIKENDKSLITKLQQDVVKMENERKNIYKEFIQKNPGSLVCLYAAEMYGSIDIENPLEVEKMIHLLNDTLQKTNQMIALQEEVEARKKIMIGQPAPGIAQIDTSGAIISLDRLKGKYVLVDFWASWCKPCRAQNPFLVSLFNRFKNRDFIILGVSLDSYKNAWVKAITDDHLEWLQISDLKGWSNEAAITYSIFSVPQNYLLDKNGIIIAKNLNERDLLKTLTQIISQKP